MTELATIHHWPQVERPILVMAMEGWVDAGLAATTATANLLGAMPNQLIATFDEDELIDYRARRPTLRIVNGIDTELHWANIRLLAATNRTGRTVLVLTGPEPDMRWHQFVSEVVQLASRLEAELVVGLVPSRPPCRTPDRSAWSVLRPRPTWPAGSGTCPPPLTYRQGCKVRWSSLSARPTYRR